MRPLLLGFAIVVTFSSMVMGRPEVRNPELGAFFEEQFVEMKKRMPSSAHLWWGDASYQTDLDDPSPAGRQKMYIYAGGAMQGLLGFDYDELSTEDQISFDMFRWNLEIHPTKRYFYRKHFVLSHMEGLHNLKTPLFTRAHTINSLEDAEAYVERLSKMETHLEQFIEQMQRQAEAGFLSPSFVYPKAIRTTRNLLKGAPFDDEGEHPVFSYFSEKVGALDISDEQKENLIKRAKECLLGAYQRGALKLVDELQRQDKLADSEAGVWRLPNGEEFYVYSLEMHTTTSELSPDEIHQIGLREVERIHGEIHGIMEQVGFEGTLQEFFHYMRTDDRFYYPDTEEGRQQLMSDARSYIEAIKPKLPEYFNRMPKADLEVLPVEKYREDSAGMAFYVAPTRDGSLPGRYYINMKSMRAFPKYSLESLTYHEALPGHHFDLSLKREMENVPSFQNYFGATAFSEGWGLYAERLGKEMGFLQDPYSEFGRLGYELLRAIRLVVDTGIHAKKWDRQRFVDYFIENSAMDENDANHAFERYTVMPGQATAYMIGMLKILELRQRAKDALGDDFHIGKFHEAVLEHGSVTLPVLEKNIDRWIAKELSKDL